jgi:hypothetical protein
LFGSKEGMGGQDFGGKAMSGKNIILHFFWECYHIRGDIKIHEYFCCRDYYYKRDINEFEIYSKSSKESSF